MKLYPIWPETLFDTCPAPAKRRLIQVNINVGKEAMAPLIV